MNEQKYPAHYARKLPERGYPRYVQVGQSISDCARDSDGKAVRITTTKWVSTKRWNELVDLHKWQEETFEAAKQEAEAARARGKRTYAELCVRLELDNPGFISRRTAIAIHAAQIA